MGDAMTTDERKTPQQQPFVPKSLETPERVQLRRTAGWRKPPNTVVVSRPTKWGNPYTHGEDRSRVQAVMDFRNDLLEGRLQFTVEDVRRELRGKSLACWCSLGNACHADILLGIANDL